MSTETVLVSEVIPASRHAIYAAWLDTRQHSAFTGDAAVIDAIVGGRHSTFGGYASGTMLELEPHRRIVQSWRSTEFPENSPDSRLEVTLEDTAGGTLVTILHTQIPAGQGDRYKDGWIQYYLEPLKRYFSKRVSNGVNGHRYGLVHAEKEDHVGENERENEDDLELHGEAGDRGDDLDDEADDQDQAQADLDDDDTVLAGAGSADEDDLGDDTDDQDDLRAGRGDDDDGEDAVDDTVEVGADAIEEVNTDDVRQVVARPEPDERGSGMVVEDMTGGYGGRAGAKASKPKAKAKAKPAARKPAVKAKQAAKTKAKSSAKKPAKKPAKAKAKSAASAKASAKSAKAKAPGKKAKQAKPVKKAAAKVKPKAKAKAKAKRR